MSNKIQFYIPAEFVWETSIGCYYSAFLYHWLRQFEKVAVWNLFRIWLSCSYDSSALFGYFSCIRRLRFIITYTFSIGLKSGLWAGQGSTLIAFRCKYSATLLARCGPNPSCWCKYPILALLCLFLKVITCCFNTSKSLNWLKDPEI